MSDTGSCTNAANADAGDCPFDDESCVTLAAPDQLIDDLGNTGQTYVALPVPYGHSNCPGGVIEISNRSLGAYPGLYISSSWDRGQTQAPCTVRQSHFSVWVQLDHSVSDAGHNNWTLYDQVTVQGVETPSAPNTCRAQVQCRLKDLPASMTAASCDSPVSFVALNPQAMAGRVTSVRVIARARSQCEALPLEFLVSPQPE